MLPTVLEETEEDLITPDQVESSSQPNCHFKSGQSFSASASNDICIYPLDITDIIKGYNQKNSWSYPKPSGTKVPGEFGVKIITLHQLFKMGEVLKSTEFEMASSNGQQVDVSSSQSSSQNEVGKTVPKVQDSAVSNGGSSSEKKAADDANTDVKDEERSDGRNRKDSESGRSVGEEGERRNSGRKNYRNGGNNRNGGNRNNTRRQRDKKWWVCPDPACRTRNSIEATGCNNCGLVQEKRGGRPPYARNWEKTRVTGMSITHVSSPTVVYGQTQQQQTDYARLRNCMAQAYAEASYRPSLVAAKMLLGVKIGEGYERVRTEEHIDQTPPEGDAATQEAGGAQEGKSPADNTALASSPEKRSGTRPPSIAGHESPLHSSPGRDSPTSSSTRWRVQLVDRGSWGTVLEADLHFLLAGLSDLAPLAAKYTLNELRLKRDSTEQQMEQSRLWLEEQTKDAKVDCDVYRQTKDGSSVLYLDMYKGETLLNRAICELGGVEPKTNLRWLKPGSRVSTSSVEEGGASPPPRDGRTSRLEMHSSNPDGTDLCDSNNDTVTNEGHDTAPKEQRPPRREGDARQSSESRTAADGTSIAIAASGDVRVFAADPEGSSGTSGGRAAMDGRDRSSSTTTGNSTAKDGSTSRRGGWWSNRRRQSRETQQRLPPLQDWAVLCFDPRTAQPALRVVCEQVERAGREGGRSPATAPDSIRQEGCEDEASMVAVLADTIASHPRLLLLLCVLPQHLKDYSGLEGTGRNLGVCVVCIRGESLVDFDPSAASRLLKDLQSALLNSPAILPYQGFSNASNTSNNEDDNSRRRENRNRRNQNKRRGSASRGRGDSAGGRGRATSPRDGSVVSDPRLQAVIGAASQGISLLQKLSQQPGGQLAESALSPGMKSLLQSPAAHQDIAKALESLEDLQVSYKQARTYTHEAFQAAGSFFSHLSNAITPPVTTAE